MGLILCGRICELLSWKKKIQKLFRWAEVRNEKNILLIIVCIWYHSETWKAVCKWLLYCKCFLTWTANWQSLVWVNVLVRVFPKFPFAFGKNYFGKLTLVKICTVLKMVIYAVRSSSTDENDPNEVLEHVLWVWVSQG